MERCCSWDRDALEWRGLNVHNPLMESVGENADLTPEELEELARARLENTRTQKAEWYQANAVRVAEYAAEYQRTHRERIAAWAKANAERITVSQKRRDAKVAARRRVARVEKWKAAKARGDPTCDLCQRAYKFNDTLRRQNRNKHGCSDPNPNPAKRAARIEKWEAAKARGDPTCDLCQAVFKSKDSLGCHNRKKHRGSNPTRPSSNPAANTPSDDSPPFPTPGEITAAPQAQETTALAPDEEVDEEEVDEEEVDEEEVDEEDVLPRRKQLFQFSSRKLWLLP